MEKSLKIQCFIFLFSLILSTHYSVFAAGSNKNTLDTKITTNSFIDGMNPDKIGEKSTSGQLASSFIIVIQGIVNPVLGILQVIGGFLMVVSFAIFGFGLIASGNNGWSESLGLHKTPNQKENLLKFGRNLLIGSSLLFAGSTVVVFVFKAVH